VVALIESRLVLPEVDHGFDREYHPWSYLGSGSFLRSVKNMRILMELHTDSMSCIVADDRTSLLFLSVLRYRMPDISEVGSWTYLLDPDLEGSSCDIDHFPRLRRDRADTIHPRSISEVSIDDRSDIDIEDISIFQDLVLPRDSMTDHAIERYARETRIASLSPYIISFIVDTCGCTTISDGEFVHDRIELFGRYSCLHIGCDHIEDIMRETRCLSDTCDLFRGLDDNFI
jgi:hypothetical protein